jgi:hypothetical protein
MITCLSTKAGGVCDGFEGTWVAVAGGNINRG